MTMATPSFSQIKSQVAAVHQKLPLARVIGIHSNGRWTGDSQKRDGEHALSIHQCDSPLAIRQALREPVDEATTKVLVAPLAATASLLLTVIDGMSVAVARELQADLPKHEWTTLCEPEQPFNRPGISTIPSVTEFARTSLMCGRLQQGGQPEERSGIASHPALVTHCRSGYPPVLFHKAAYQGTDDAVLSADIRKEIASTALARALDHPVLRLPGLLAKVQRLLNVDGYGVLDREDASDTVELNRDLLLKQFDLV